MAFFFSSGVRSRSFFPRRNVAVFLLSGLLASSLTMSVVRAQQAPAATQAPDTTAAKPQDPLTIPVINYKPEKKKKTRRGADAKSAQPPAQATQPSAAAQSTEPATTAEQQSAPTSATTGDLPAGTRAATPQDDAQTPSVSYNAKRSKTRKGADEAKTSKKDQKVVASKDTLKEQREQKRKLRDNPLANVNSSQPDKQLYDRAQVALKKGKYDVARLLLQDMLATYPDSEYQMRAKLAFADSWYREGGTAALTQAETEYHDFIIFFPNVPEAAEAQMRIGDIYFKQMDKPDRDYTKAVHAQEEYRTMMTQYPDSTLVAQAKQKLREVQEVLATRETGVADFYEGHENYAAAIARYQTVVDTYPLYSKIDTALIGLGDAYTAQAHYVRVSPNMKGLSEDQRSRLLRVYEDQAAAAYGRVVTVYNSSPRVEDARDRLEALGRPIPEPTAEQVAASQALENSRQTYNLTNRAKGLIVRGPDMVQASRLGEPSMADPKATLAPNVVKRIDGEFRAALAGKAPAPAPQPAVPEVGVSTDAGAPPAGDAGTPGTPGNATTTLQDIPAADAPGAGSGAAAATSSFADTPTGVATPTGSGSRTAGVTIITPGATAEPNAGNGLNAVGPASNAALPPIEKPAVAPDAVNDVSGVATPRGQVPPEPNAKGKVKNPTPEYDKGEESSSKHKRKKGLKKLDPLAK